jgi:hypothetical protein
MSGMQRPSAARDGRPDAAPRKPGAGTHRWTSRAVRLCWPGIVRLPGSQPLLLSRIERSLVAEDFRLDSAFAIFTRSARGQEMPSAERIPSWSRTVRAGGMPTAALAAGGVVVLSLLIAIQPDQSG